MIDFDLDSVLATPTQSRSEIESDENNDFDLSDLEFEDHEEDHIQSEIDSALNSDDARSESKEPKEPKVKLITEKEARTGAELAISLVDSINQFGLSRLASWKLKRKLGSKKLIEKMQELFVKELEGEELTKKEQNQLAKYNRYLKDKEGIPEIVSFPDEQREKLVSALADYFKQKQIHFGGKDSFWFEFLIAEGMMIMEVLAL